jgi:hypothetical protein
MTMAAEQIPDPDDRFAQRLAARLRNPVPLSDSVEREVLRRIVAERNGYSPRFSRGSTFQAWAIAAGIALVFGLGVLVGRRSARPNDAETKSVEFVLHTRAESSVVVVGDFNDWNPRATPLRHTADSLWSVIIPLRPGRYRYTFVVDGTEWRRDPGAPRALEDDFGTPTSVITVAQR